MFPSCHESFQHEDLEVLVHVTVHTTHHLHDRNIASYMTGATVQLVCFKWKEGSLLQIENSLPKRTQEAINSSAFISAKLLFYLQNSTAFRYINLTSCKHTNDMEGTLFMVTAWSQCVPHAPKFEERIPPTYTWNMISSLSTL